MNVRKLKAYITVRLKKNPLSTLKFPKKGKAEEADTGTPCLLLKARELTKNRVIAELPEMQEVAVHTCAGFQDFAMRIVGGVGARAEAIKLGCAKGDLKGLC